jgi:hypothetical protein
MNWDGILLLLLLIALLFAVLLSPTAYRSYYKESELSRIIGNFCSKWRK